MTEISTISIGQRSVDNGVFAIGQMHLLNAVVLDKSEEKATIVQQYVSIKNEKKLPSVFF